MFGFVSTKNLLRLLLLVAVVVAFFLIKPCDKAVEEETRHVFIVERIEELGKLELNRFSISDMISYEKRRTWLPNSHTAIMVMGEVITCIDLSQIVEEDVYIKGDSMSITLPLPEICNFKIDHSQSKIYDVKYGLWETHKLVDEAYKQAETQIYEQAIKMNLPGESKESARKFLTPFFKLMGFEKIHIQFKETPFGEAKPRIEGIRK